MGRTGDLLYEQELVGGEYCYFLAVFFGGYLGGDKKNEKIISFIYK